MREGGNGGRRARRVGIVAAAAAGVFIAIALVVPRLVDEASLRGGAERRLSAAAGRKVSIARARISILFGPRVELEGIRIEPPPESREETWTGRAETATVGIAFLPLLRGAVEARSLRVSGVEIDRGPRPVLREGAGRARLSGKAPGELRARGEASGRAALFPGAPRSRGTFVLRRVGEELAFDAVELALGPLRLRAEGSLAGLSGRDPAVRFEGTASIGDTIARGGFELFLAEEAPRLEFRVASPFVHVDELIERWTRSGGAPRAASGWFPAAHAASPPAPEGVSWLSTFEADGTLDADGGRWRGVTLGAFSARVTARGGLLRFDPVRSDVHGGRGEGSLEIRVAEPALPFVLSGRLDDVDLSTLSAEIAKKPAGVLDGRATLELALSGRAAAEPVVGTLRGTARLAAADGRIKSVGLVKRLGEFLQMTGGRGGEVDESPFERMTTTLRIEGGKARTEDLEFRSRDLDLDGGGTVGLDGALALDVVAALSREASAAVVARTPQLRFRVGSDGRLTVPMKLRGTLGSPYVQVDLEKVLEEGLRDEIRKRGEKSLLRRLLGR